MTQNEWRNEYADLAMSLACIEKDLYLRRNKRALQLIRSILKKAYETMDNNEVTKKMLKLGDKVKIRKDKDDLILCGDCKHWENYKKIIDLGRCKKQIFYKCPDSDDEGKCLDCKHWYKFTGILDSGDCKRKLDRKVTEICKFAERSAHEKK